MEELPTADIAASLALSESTVRVRFMRARRLLQAAISQDIDVHAPAAFRFGGARCDRVVASVHARLQPGRLPPAAAR